MHSVPVPHKVKLYKSQAAAPYKYPHLRNLHWTDFRDCFRSIIDNGECHDLSDLKMKYMQRIVPFLEARYGAPNGRFEEIEKEKIIEVAKTHLPQFKGLFHKFNTSSVESYNSLALLYFRKGSQVERNLFEIWTQISILHWNSNRESAIEGYTEKDDLFDNGLEAYIEPILFNSLNNKRKLKSVHRKSRFKWIRKMDLQIMEALLPTQKRGHSKKYNRF